MEDINTNIETKVEDIKVDESTVETAKVEDKKFLQITQEDLDEIITKRLDRASKKAEEVKAEAEKLASMSTEERFKAEFDKEKASFAEERKQYQIEKLELQVVRELSTKGLPTEFSKYLIGTDAETCMSNIKEFDLHWQQALATALDGKLRGTTPKTGGSKADGVSKEDFAKMGYKEKSKMFTENPELYKILSK